VSINNTYIYKFVNSKAAIGKIGRQWNLLLYMFIYKKLTDPVCVLDMSAALRFPQGKKSFSTTNQLDGDILFNQSVNVQYTILLCNVQ